MIVRRAKQVLMYRSDCIRYQSDACVTWSPEAGSH